MGGMVERIEIAQKNKQPWESCGGGKGKLGGRAQGLYIPSKFGLRRKFVICLSLCHHQLLDSF